MPLVKIYVGLCKSISAKGKRWGEGKRKRENSMNRDVWWDYYDNYGLLMAGTIREQYRV